MGILYRILSALIYFLLWPYGKIRALFGNNLWRGRLGLIDNLESIDIWIHASSAGETKIAGFLVDYLKHKNPGVRIYLSTMTTAGQKISVEFRNQLVSSGFFLIDSKGPVRRTFDKIKPRMFVIAETEIWPNLIVEANSRSIPLILVNGRMSDRAFKKYKMAGQLMARLLSSYEKIFVKSADDKKKIGFFRVNEERITIGGDMKFDAPLLVHDQSVISRTRKSLGAGENDFVLMAGSTRPGEEKLLVQLLQTLKTSRKRILLVIAPRHLNRIEQVKFEVSSQNLKCSIYMSESAPESVILVDKMGLLNELYQAADLAFVGGTLVDVGGHNILEPVWAGTPVVFGPYVGNISEASDYIIENNYGGMVNSIVEMTELVRKFVDNRKMFAIKTEDDLSHSPTATAGDFILELMKRA